VPGVDVLASRVSEANDELKKRRHAEVSIVTPVRDSGSRTRWSTVES
jgi:hypothetical protein